MLVAVLLLGLVPVAAAPAGVTVYCDPTAPAAITVDGKITAEEWGEPAAVFTYQEVAKRQKDWTAWLFFGTSSDAENQSLELYARRDEKALYFAFRFANIHHIDYGYTAKDGWRHAGMKFVFGAYDPETFIGNGVKDGQAYEQWLSYTFRMKYDVDADLFTPVISAGGSIGQESYQKPEAAIFIDEDTYSYDYEVVLPYEDLYGVVTADTEELAMSFEMTDARVAGKESGNRWFVSQAVKTATEEKDPQAFYNSNPLHLIFGEEPVPEVLPEDSTSDIPEESDPPLSSLYWIIPIIAVGVLIIVVAVVIVIKRSRKENQK